MKDDHLHESKVPLPSALAENGFQLCACNGVDAIIPPLCQMPAGAFLMGSNGNASHATPQSQIAVTAFAMAMFPVTVAEYALYLHANPSIAPPSDNAFPTAVNWLAPGWQGKQLTWALQQQQPDGPVVNVSWFNARDYAV